MTRRFVPRRATLIAACIALGAGVSTPRAQQPATRLHGQIVSRTTGVGIAGAQIILDADGRSVTSDSSGAYLFANIPRGRVDVTVRAPGFIVEHLVLELSGPGNWLHVFDLAPAGAGPGATKLGPVAVTAEAPEENYRLRDFEIRRTTGRGQYLTDKEIKESGASNIQDAVRNMRGVLLDCGGTMYGGCRIRMSRAPERCTPEYVVDGQVDNDFGPLTPIRDVIAIEVYTGPSDVPGDFAGRNSGCGVIALWTRSGPDRPREKSDTSR